MADLGEKGAGGAGRATGDRPTLKTIAYMTGLGITTVSRALKDAPDIGAETKQRVRMIAKQIGYRPNRAGVRLRTGKTNVISLILKTEEEVMGLTTEMICGISEVLAETQYHLIVTPYTRGQDPMEPVRYVLETGSADGIIISRIEPDDPRVRYMLDHDFPFATHGRTNVGLAHPYHDFDNYAFAAEAVRRLVARGRRRLALIGPPKHLSYYAHMQAGFSDAVAEAGVEEMTVSGITIDDKLTVIKDHVAAIMRRRNRPDGFVSGSGAGAIGIVPGIESAGLHLGHDVDLAAKQSTEILQWFRPEIIVMFEDFRLAGRELARAVLARIEGRPASELQSICEPA